LLARSSKILYNADYTDIAPDSWESALAGSSQPVPSWPAVAEFLAGAPGPVILVDNTSDAALATAYPDFVSRGVSIATPNKKAFSGDLALWNAIFAAASNGLGSGGFVFHESTVGAGLPVLSTIKELMATGDVVKRVEGVFSGTMSYLFNNWNPVSGEDGGSFSAAVAQARELGYTEPDPRDDLNGMDVARKCTILARLAGLQVENATAFPTQSLIPKELETAKSADEFLAGLPRFDSDMEKLRNEATNEGKVVRFVGSVDVVGQAVKVGLEKFDKSHPIAALKGSDNIIAIYTERYGSNPLIIQGAG
jgi:homoserine dehydrogenase